MVTNPQTIQRIELQHELEVNTASANYMIGGGCNLRIATHPEGQIIYMLDFTIDGKRDTVFGDSLLCLQGNLAESHGEDIWAWYKKNIIKSYIYTTVNSLMMDGDMSHLEAQKQSYLMAKSNPDYPAQLVEEAYGEYAASVESHLKQVDEFNQHNGNP